MNEQKQILRQQLKLVNESLKELDEFQKTTPLSSELNLQLKEFQSLKYSITQELQNMS